jgi:hypothetical protein
MNLKEQILKAVDSPVEALEIPEWGVTVYLKSMSVGERLKFRELLKADESDEAELLVLALSDEQGKPLFTKADIPELRKKNSKVTDAVLHRWLEINGLTLKSSEEAEKK